MNLNEDYTGKTTLAKWWKIVKENFQKIATAFNAEVQARKDAVSAEASARQTADSDLASRLSKVEQISGGTGGGNSLNNYEYDYDSEDDTVINIYTVTALPSGIYTFIPEKEVTALYTVIADSTAPWYCEGNVFIPGNQYILQAGDSDNMDVIGVIPLNPDDGNFINVKLSEIVTAEYSDGTYRFDVSTFAELNKTLVVFNDLDNDVAELLVNDMYGYTITQALETGKLYVTVTTKLHEDNGIDGQYSGAIDVYAWNGPESGGGSSITVDSELSNTSTNPVQNKAVTEKIDSLNITTTSDKTGFSAGENAITSSGGAVGSGAYSESGGAIGDSAEALAGGAVGANATTGSGGAIGGSAESEEGGAVGSGAKCSSGGAIGDSAKTSSGGAVGKESSSGSGGAVGESAIALAGGAVGRRTKSGSGGAIGTNAITSSGFAGGANAKTQDESENAIDAVQLGTGTNSNPYTMQVYNYKIIATDAEGASATSEKWLADVGKLSTLATDDKTTIIAAINELVARVSTLEG